MEKAKEAISESVIKGTTRVPGKQLVIIISRSQEGTGDNGKETTVQEVTGDQMENATLEEGSGDQGKNAAADVPSGGSDGNESAESSSKIPRLEEGESNS